MSWKHFGSLIVCVIIALSLVIIGSIEGSNILYAFALAVISVGLGASSLMITLHTDRRMTEMNETLARVEHLQE